MSLVHLSLHAQAMFVLAALVVFLGFALLAQERLLSAVHLFAWQGALLAATTALAAYVTAAPHLYITALLTLVLKALLIPWMLHRLIRHLELERHTEAVQGRAALMLVGASMVIFSYWVALPIEQLELSATRNIIALSLGVVLLGLLLMVSRHQVVYQVIGFMVMENGLFMAAVSTTRGMPLVVELGIAFDVLVAMVLFGVFFFQIRESIDSLDVDRLNRLAEREEE